MKKYILLLLIPLLFVGSYLFAGPEFQGGGGAGGTTPTVTAFVVAASDTTVAKRNTADYICDGTADEVQINAALTALPANGGRVMLLEGTYTTADPITFPKNNCILEGQGRSTFIDGDGLATGEHAILVPARTGSTIKNLRIQTEDGGAKVCHGIYATGTCNNLEIDGVIITDSDSDGIHILPDNAYEIYIYNCIIDDADGYGIYVDPTPADYNYNMHIKDCLIIGTGSSGIYFGSTGAGSWYAEVGSNMIYSAGGQGIQATEMFHSDFSNNISTANTSDGIILNGSHTGIEGGQYYANGGNGIELATALECSVEGTVCNDNTSSGIELDGGSDLVLIANNHCCGNTLDGIRVGGTRDNIIGNFCQDNDLHGINLGNPDCRVSDNLIYDNSQGGAGTSHGINIGNDADRTLVSGNHINDPGDSTEDGIFLTDGAINCLIIGNYAYNLMGDGIKLAGNNTGTVIEGNTCHTLDENGIVVSDSLDCKISNNYCLNNTHHGIYLDNADRALVIGNTCNGNDRLDAGNYDGIYVDADSASCAVNTNYLYANHRKGITDSGTGTHIEDNVGADETVTTATPALQHWGYSYIDTSGNDVNATLAAGSYPGQIKTIVCTDQTSSAGGGTTVVVAAHEDGDAGTYTFKNVDDICVFMWKGTEWCSLHEDLTP